jgi:hypothetical protein
MLFLHGTRDMVIRKRCWQCLECSDAIRHQDLNEQLCLRKEKTGSSGRNANSWGVHQTVENECQDIVERSAPSKTKEETTNKSIRAIDI